MKTRVRSPDSLSGWRIWRCRELWCRSQMWLGSSISVAVVWARGYSSTSTPSLGTSMCHGCSLKKTKKKKKKKKKKKEEGDSNDEDEEERNVSRYWQMSPREEKHWRCFVLVRCSLPRSSTCVTTSASHCNSENQVATYSFLYYSWSRDREKKQNSQLNLTLQLFLIYLPSQGRKDCLRMGSRDSNLTPSWWECQVPS